MRQSTIQIKSLAGRLIIAGFEGYVLPKHLKEMIAQGALGGIVLFSRNIDSPKQVAKLIREAKSLEREKSKLLVCVDQEGGRVVRLRSPLTVLPPARKFGLMDDPVLTKDAGVLVGRELSALGFTVNFAPVLDIDTNPKSPVIGDRSYGEEPAVVTKHGLAFASGLHLGGVLPCAKHFPGHGDAAADSHVSLPRVTRDISRLEQTEMHPFGAWVASNLGPIMTAHVVYPSLDPNNPATCSPSIVEGELRDKLCFRGVVFTDDLEMGAVEEVGGPKNAACKAVDAGVDGLLVCKKADLQLGILEKLVSKAEQEPSFLDKIKASADRINSISDLPVPEIDFSWIGSSEHRQQQSSLFSRMGEEVL